ncbi:hypothetical protein ACQ4WX_35100 [Streptomyces lasalocidi]
MFGGEDSCHAAFGQVAAGEGDPFGVHLAEHCGDQPLEGGRVEEDLHDVGAALDLTVGA